MAGGAETSVAELLSSARRLAARLSGASVGRMAIVSDDARQIAVCLVAVCLAGCGLLVAREALAAAIPDWRELGVEALVTADGDLLSLAPGSGRADGEPRVLIPTSGTTGKPKVAEHRLKSLLGRIRVGAEPSRARWLLTYQPQGFAGIQVILTVLAAGGTLVAPCGEDAAGLFRTALECGATHISGTPTFWRSFLLAGGDQAKLVPVRQATLGGETVDQAILDRLRTSYPQASISHIYASTEAGAVFSVRDGRAGFPSAWLLEPVEGVALRLRDGLLEVRSERRMLGYLGVGGASCEGGWIATRDRVEVKGDRAFFLGREDTVINVGGAKVSPEEVEACLLAVPGVEDLRVFPVPNPITGYVLGAEVAPSEGADLSVLRSQIVEAATPLGSARIPRLIRFVSAVAREDSGKKSRVGG